MKSRRFTTVVATLALALVACTSHAPQEDRYTGYPEGQVFLDLLQRRSVAFSNGDERAWLADVDPSQAQVVEHERMVFRNLRQLGAEQVQFRPEPPYVQVCSRTLLPVPGRPAPVKVCRYEVLRIMSLPGDLDTAMTRYTYMVAKVGNRAMLVDAQPAGGATRPGNPASKTGGANGMASGEHRDQPWDLVPLRVASRGSVVVAAPEASRWNPADYVASADKAARQVIRLWGKHERPRKFLLLLATEEEAVTWFEAGESKHALATTLFVAKWHSISDRIDPNESQNSVAARIVMRMERIEPAEVYQVLVHEIAHAISTPYYGPGILGAIGAEFARPDWAVEGFARWVETAVGADPSLGHLEAAMSWGRKRGLLTGALPENKKFYADNAARTSFNYELGATVFEAVARQPGGRRKAVDVYLDLLGSVASFNTSIGSVALSMDRYHIDQNSFMRAWRQTTGLA